MLSPESRKVFSNYLCGLFAVLVLPCVVQAELPAEIDDVRACRELGSDAQRLLCYDSVVDDGVFTRQQAKQAVVESFGNSRSQPDVVEDEIEQLPVTIVRVRKSDTGTRYFYTSDEQVWKQTSRGNWSLKAPFEAQIKAGVMGSFFLVTDGGKSMRVKRVR